VLLLLSLLMLLVVVLLLPLPLLLPVLGLLASAVVMLLAVLLLPALASACCLPCWLLLPASNPARPYPLTLCIPQDCAFVAEAPMSGHATTEAAAAVAAPTPAA
jgi:hypothetical protein